MSKRKVVKGPATAEARAKLSRKMKRIWAERRALKAKAEQAIADSRAVQAAIDQAPAPPPLPELHVVIYSSEDGHIERTETNLHNWGALADLLYRGYDAHGVRVHEVRVEVR